MHEGYVNLMYFGSIMNTSVISKVECLVSVKQYFEVGTMRIVKWKQ